MNFSNVPNEQPATRIPGDTPMLDFAGMVRDAGEAIITLDAAGRVTSWNAAAEALLGYRAVDICGQPAPHLLPAGRQLGAGRRITVRRHSSGRTVQLVASVAALRDAKGSNVGWSEVLTQLPDTSTPAVPDDEELAPALAHALERGELHLLYQPIFRLSDRRAVGVEALLRWRNGGDSHLLPGQFIQCAEREGLIGPIGLFVLRSACSQIATWMHDGGRVLPVSVNVSAHQFRLPDFATAFAGVIKTSGIDPRLLKLEVTESAIVEDPDTASAQLDTLRALGVSIAIDDFGVGYSSLSRLRQYHIDTLKLDHSFVRDIADDAIAREVAGAVILLAHRLGMTVVAEGVETEAQYATLLTLDCDYGQGFLLARPLSESEIPALA